MKIGIDLVKISEVSKKILEDTVGKVFLPTELAQNTTKENLAGIFAAKEAFFKAIGKKVDWLDVWIEKDDQGQPKLFSNYLSSTQNSTMSITHQDDFAIAVVIIED